MNLEENFMQKNYKLGLKLWSINVDFYYKEAKTLYNQGVFNYIELYIVPDTLQYIKQWKELHIPFILHAPHFVHGVNLADKTKFNYNKQIYEQVELYRQELNSQYTIIHAGTIGDIHETINQLNQIKPKNFVIENKPSHPPYFKERECRGASFEELLLIIENTGCKFCLDISHAICTANTLNLDPYNYIQQLESLQPSLYHICDGDISSSHDQHLHIGQGNYDFSKIFKIISNKPISVETKKDSKNNLNDFIIDVEKINEI